MAKHEFTLPGLSKEIVEAAGLQRIEPIANNMAEEFGFDEPEFRVGARWLAKAFNEGVLFASSEIFAQMQEAGATVTFVRPLVSPSDEATTSD